MDTPKKSELEILRARVLYLERKLKESKEKYSKDVSFLTEQNEKLTCQVSQMIVKNYIKSHVDQ
jgi:uncharacterized membrane protein